MHLSLKEYAALRRIVLMYAPDEGKDYQEQGKPRGHIYRDLLTLARILDRERPTTS